MVLTGCDVQLGKFLWKSPHITLVGFRKLRVQFFFFWKIYDKLWSVCSDRFYTLSVFLNKCNVWENKCRNIVIAVSSDNTIYDNNQPVIVTLSMSECREARRSNPSCPASPGKDRKCTHLQSPKAAGEFSRELWSHTVLGFLNFC